MYVACSTLCFSRGSLEAALRMIAELEFSRVDVAIRSRGPHLRPHQVAEDPVRAAQLLRMGPGLTPGAFYVEIDEHSQERFDYQFLGVCRMARHAGVATLAINAAPTSTDMAAEICRLKHLVSIASTEGVVVAVKTRLGTWTEYPDLAVELCQRVEGLGLTLDPSPFVCGPHGNKPYDQVFPYVRHVHLRDTGLTPEKFQVRVGQGEIEYGRIITQLQRHGYDRLLTVAIHDAAEQPFPMETEVRKLKFLLESLI